MKKLIIVLFLSLYVIDTYSQEKNFVREYNYQASEHDSKISARKKAIEEIKYLLLEEIGVYVISSTEYIQQEKDFKYTDEFKSKIQSITGSIAKTEILKENWNGYQYYIKASISVDTILLMNNLQNLIDTKESSNFKKQDSEILNTNYIQKLIDNANDGETIIVNPGTYLGRLILKNKNKLTIDFTGVKVITHFDETIFTIKNSSQIYIKGLTLFHEIGKDRCFTNCFDIDYCQNVVLNNCDINGSGFIGVCANQSDVTIKNSVIHECVDGVFIWDRNDSFNKASLTHSWITIKNTKFLKNKNSNVNVYSHYAKNSTIYLNIDDKSYTINKDNYSNFLKRSDGSDCVIY